MKYFHLAFLWMLFPFVLSSQSSSGMCGTISPSIKPDYDNPGDIIGVDRKLQSKESVLQPRQYHFPLRITVFNDELKKITAQEIDAQISKLNLVFSGANIRFSKDEINYIEDSLLQVMRLNLEPYVHEKYFQKGRINLYFFPTLIGDDQNYTGYTYTPVATTTIPLYQQDMIMLSFDAIYEKSTIAHEMGHFFGLLHTHDTQFGKESVSGDDCLRHGDGICDTPADPNLQGKVNNLTGKECRFTDPDDDRDTQGMPYSPSVYNIMSYSEDGCRCEFTQGQYWAIERTALFIRQHLGRNDSKKAIKAGNTIWTKGGYFKELSSGRQDIIYDYRKSRTILFNYNANINWCNRMFEELLSSPVYAPFIGETGSYNLVVYNTDISKESLPDLIGNETLPNELRNIFLGELNPELVRFPGVYVLQFNPKESQYTKVLLAHNGYMKPRDLSIKLQALKHPTMGFQTVNTRRD